ncbi:MAG: aminopeptidase [Wenzhouxiangellaceae bacterium]|nr:aminopeptidase [Wenzhouxiangellaceae bacterium]
MRQNSSSPYHSSIVVLAVAACLGAAGCSTLGWYFQAARGQLELLAKREDIEKVIAAPDTSPEVRRKLETALEARAFAAAELALPDDGSYSDYVELDRDAVLFNVVATPEFSLEPKTWCYPFAGCLAYRGYFRRRAAESLAERLAEDGMDTAVAPVAAYSTLGWFDDPVTSPMLAWDETRLAGLIFHELAHQRVFVKGDTAFNEAYATAVGRAGVRRWLDGQPGALAQWQRQRALDQRFVGLLLATKDALERIYAEGGSPAELRARKRARFEQFERDYTEFRERHETNAFDRFMRRDLNNAHLAQVATYEAGVRAFADLLAEYGGDFERFHQAVDRLASAGREARAEFLNRCRARTSQ